MRVGNGIDRFLIGGFKSIGGIDFCEVTKEDVLEWNAYLKLKIGV
jgi:hypothetical protein